MKNIRLFSKKYQPEILIGLGIAGMFATVIMAVKATPKALRLMDEKKEEVEAKTLTFVDKVKTAGTCYISAAVIGILSISCFVGAASATRKRIDAFTTAYTISGSALKEYQAKVVEQIGEKKEREIRDAIAKDKVDKHPIRDVILTEKGGNTVCYDALSGRYFKSDRDIITKAVNELNRRMRDEMVITLNEFYYEIGLDNIKVGDLLGWEMDTGYLDISFSSQLDANGTPCLVIDYPVMPVYGY